MIQSEEFSLFFKEFFHAVHDFFGNIFSIEILFAHLGVVIGSLCDVCYER